MLWARVDYKELVSKKSGFVNCSEKKPSHCSASALWLIHYVFANLLIDERVKEQDYYVSSTLLLLFYSFIGFSRRAKTNFIETISHLCIRLFLATCRLNTEMTSWYHGLGENKIPVQCSCVRFECTLLRFLLKVSIEWRVNESFV